MTKMDMIWVAVASMIHPATASSITVTREQIEEQVKKLLGISITPVMLDKHLVSWEDRQADIAQPRRGGSRNRYLFKTTDGHLPAHNGRFRLYKAVDGTHDGGEKTGSNSPDHKAVAPEYRHLIAWYEDKYYASK